MLPRSALRRAQTDTCTRLKGRWKDLIEVAITANDDLRGNVANETEIDDSREDVGKKNSESLKQTTHNSENGRS